MTNVDKKKFAVGVDLGATHLRAALVSIEGGRYEIHQREHRVIVEHRHPDAMLNCFVDLFAKFHRAAPDLVESAPLGIGMAAMLDGDAGYVANAPNLRWVDVPFGELLRKKLNRAVWIENDLSAIAWGEACFGAGQQATHLLCVYVGTGVGGGFVCHGTLFRGATNVSVELGHLRFIDEGRQCGCGARGCVEAYAGGAQLVAWALEDPSDLLKQRCNGDLTALHAGHLEEAARHGDAKSRSILEQAGHALGYAIAHTITLLNPDRIILGGPVWKGCSLLRETAHEWIAKNANPPARKQLQFVEPMLGEDAGILGAASLALQASAND